jgi:hypothetical protein
MESASTPAQRVRSIFVSDVHLGTRACQAEPLLEFLRAYEGENVFLLGDIVDRSNHGRLLPEQQACCGGPEGTMPYSYDTETRIALVDYRNMTSPELIAEADRVHNEARTHLEGVRVKALVDIRGARLNAEALQALKHATQSMSAIVERTAVVGVTGFKRVLADAIARFSGTHTKYFATKEDALRWLAEP